MSRDPWSDLLTDLAPLYYLRRDGMTWIEGGGRAVFDRELSDDDLARYLRALLSTSSVRGEGDG